MNVSCLNIRQEYAKIDITNQPARFDIKAELGKLNINTQPAVLDINTENSRMEVDTYPCRYSIGLKNVTDFKRDAAQEGMQAFQELASRIVSLSNQFSRSSAPASAIIADNAVSNAKALRPPPRINIKYIDRPQYNYTPRVLNISYQMGKVDATLTPAQFDNNSQIGSVDISMAQNASIRMWVTEGKFDTYA